MSLVYEKIALNKDIDSLKAIADKSIKVKFFDYDGKKYDRKEAGNFVKQLESRLEEVTRLVKENDQCAYQYFYKKSTEKNMQTEYAVAYQSLLDGEKQFAEYFNKINEFLPFIHFMSQVLEVDEIKKHIHKLTEAQNNFKQSMQSLISESVFKSRIEHSDMEALMKFCDTQQNYFENNTYQSDYINQLNNGIDSYYNAIYDGYFKLKKELLDLEEKIETTQV